MIVRRHQPTASHASVPLSLLTSAMTALLLATLLAMPAAAQAGDEKDPAGMVQAPLPPELVVPPAPVLTPAEALASFVVAEGLRIELVAAEPLVEDPVQIAFDERGRMWVVEMTGFMPDVDGTDEDAPVGRIVILEDVDGDGVMDRRTVFMDELVLPRAVTPTRDGALVIAPPDLLYCVDTDGDGRADLREVVDTGLHGIHSPEHAVNGLLRTHDDWYHNANHDRRYRWDGEAWLVERIAPAGQWGISQDDLGRLYFNTNSDGLRGHLVGPRYGARNPNHGGIAGNNVRLLEDQRVYPARMTPGVNRGYRDGVLDDDWKLVRFTGACGPHAQRGGPLPAPYDRAAFLCEPAGNLLKALTVTETDAGQLVATPILEGSEVLTSTDERFRPVNLHGGPDGALYVVDMYRGILQHRLFVTSFLRAQILERELDVPLGLGRIWRIVADDADVAARWRDRPDPSALPLADVVPLLDHAEGWWRDTAQRVLIERGQRARNDRPAEYRSMREALRGAVSSARTELGRRHALLTLGALQELDDAQLVAALTVDERPLSLAAARLSEPRLVRRDSPLVPLLVEAARSGDAVVRHQMLLSLGAGGTDATHAALAELITESAHSAAARSAVLSGLNGAELDFLRRLLDDPGWVAERDGRGMLLRLLARAIVREGRVAQMEGLLEDLAARRPVPVWQWDALLAGLRDSWPKAPKGGPGRLVLSREPARLRERAETLAGQQHASAEALTAVVDDCWWPGHPRPDDTVANTPLDEAGRARFARGAEVYALACALCHQSSGRGERGKAPPLARNDWVLGDPERLARILLHGMDGPVVVNGETWNLAMPVYPGSDEDIAAVLTYVRREWGHGADPVEPELVAAVRAVEEDRDQPWTAEELGGN